MCAKRTSLTSKCDLNSQLHTFLYGGGGGGVRDFQILGVCGGGGPKGFSPGNNLRDFNKRTHCPVYYTLYYNTDVWEITVVHEWVGMHTHTAVKVATIFCSPMRLKKII